MKIDARQPEHQNRWKVWLDGEPVLAWLADEEEGFVVCYEYDDAGRVREKGPGKPICQLRRGKVVIERA